MDHLKDICELKFSARHFVVLHDCVEIFFELSVFIRHLHFIYIQNELKFMQRPEVTSNKLNKIVFYATVFARPLVRGIYVCV